MKRPPRQPRIGRSPRALALAASLPLAMISPAVGGARDASSRLPQPAAVDPLDITGEDFAGLRLAVAPREGPLEFTASRATVWTSGPRTTRLFLEGDVAARIGELRLSAARAVVWLEHFTDDDGTPAVQYFIYFDRVSMPTAAPGTGGKLGLSGDRVPMGGIIHPSAGITLKNDSMKPGPSDDPLVREAERSLATVLRKMVAPTVPAHADGQPGADAGVVPGAVTFEGPSLAELEQGLPPAVRHEPIFSRSGIISIAFGQPSAGGVLRAFEDGEDSVVEFDSGIVVQYQDRNQARSVQLTAARGIVYLKPGLVEGLADGRTSFGVSDVRGFYLEGDVVADSIDRGSGGGESHYLIRAPRAFYDVQHDRALLLDAVFWTYDQQIGLPLYVRAKSIRQESASQFTTGSARVTNSSLVDPFLAIGAGSVTISRKEQAEGAPPDVPRPWIVDASHIVGRIGGVPVLYWPRYVGDPTKFPLRELSFGDSYGSGVAVKSAWDIFSLSGQEAPDGVSAELLLDFYSKRGVGLGTKATLERPDSSGDLLVFALPNDNGIDTLSTGATVEHEGDFRDALVGEYQRRIDDEWTIQLEGSYFSDETMVDTFFRGDARARREFANLAYIARVDDDSALTAQVKGSLNDFTSNQYLLQDQGYTVDRLPEATYTRVNDDLLPGGAPGLLAYNSEYRIGYYGLNFTEPLASELGFTTKGKSQAALGVDPNQSVADRLRKEGYTEDEVFRFDTRQEVTSQIRSGPVNIVPFAAGRITVYDRDFSEFDPQNSEQVRTWGSVGTRVATEVQRVDNSVENRFLDLHRMRHVIEPGVTVWYAGTNIDQEDLPVYDDTVESIADGGAVKVGANQTWQTQRGGPGRYRSVDVLTLDTDFQFSTEDSEPESPVGRWFDFRPEYSNMGDFFTADSTWQVTEATALSGNTVFDLERNRQAQTSGGIIIQHSPAFRTAMEVLYLDVEDSTFVNWLAAYDLTEKHYVATGIVYDTDLGQIQQITFEVLRRFPSVTFGISVGYNDISNESSFGFTLQPVGIEGRGARLRGLGAESDRAQSAGIGQ